MNPPMFTNRQEAGRALAAAVAAHRPLLPVVVMGLPRGGIPVAYEVAKALGAPLSLLLVRKIGAPWQRELAVAAVVDGTPPDLVIDDETVSATGTTMDWISSQARVEKHEIARRRELYLRGRSLPALGGATVIVVDDGIATGTTVRAALKALRRRHPERLMLAVPVAPMETLRALQQEVDDVVCLYTPAPFHAIGRHYVDFHQLNDAEVLVVLDAAAQRESMDIATTQPWSGAARMPNAGPGAKSVR